MKNAGKKKKKVEPILKKSDVQTSNDEHIDQDYPGFPHPPAKENIINPKSEEDRTAAGINTSNED